MTPLPTRDLLLDIYGAALRAAAPGPALERALVAIELSPASRPWIIALGKAAHPMAVAAVAALARAGGQPGGGIIVAPEGASPPHPAVIVAPGDHPQPGPRSLAAAEALGQVAAEARDGGDVWLLLSGGATSLSAAPVAGVTPAELRELFGLLLGSGMDIGGMNAVRKRVCRWGGGRLAAALAPARISCFVVSDVIADDLAAIGSGPCEPDDTTAADVSQRLTDAGLLERVPSGVLDYLARVERGGEPETPKSGDPSFDLVTSRVIAGNRIALDAAAARARVLGCHLHPEAEPVAGEARDAGARFARALTAFAAETGRSDARPTCLLAGGETVVSMRAAPSDAAGGRCQEFALAAAQVLALATRRANVALLAAGTDGRDGPTDAAGAIVDAGTWESIRMAGRDPAGDLTAHRSYRALDAAGALIRTGLTGTNVMDVVIGIAEPRVRPRVEL